MLCALPADASRVSAVTGLVLDSAVHRRTRYERLAKPVLDAVGAIVALVLALPIMVVAAASVLFKMGRPVVLRQTRIGRDGKEFAVFKFRTMEPDRRVADLPFADPDRRKVHKTPDDPRITSVGRVLRRTSIDELPQLINVLRGEMSLVGPRPELPKIVATYEPWQHARHRVKPGITGLWQLEARDEGVLMHQRTDLDIDYVESVGFTTDVKLLALTLPNVLRRGLGKRKTANDGRWAR